MMTKINGLNKALTDPRIIRTITFIHDGFLNLLRESSLEKITLEDIAVAGMTSRNTVAKYYANRYELMDEICSTVLEDLDVESIDGLIGRDILWEKTVERIFNDINKQRDFYELIVGKDRYPKFIIMLATKIANLFSKLTDVKYGEEVRTVKQAEIDSCAAFFVGGIRFWFKHHDCTEEEFIKKWSSSLKRIWKAEIAK